MWVRPESDEDGQLRSEEEAEYNRPRSETHRDLRERNMDIASELGERVEGGFTKIRSI